MRALTKIVSSYFLAFGFIASANAILPIEKLDAYKGAKAFLVQTKALPMVDIEVSIDVQDTDIVDRALTVHVNNLTVNGLTIRAGTHCACQQ